MEIALRFPSGQTGSAPLPGDAEIKATSPLRILWGAHAASGAGDGANAFANFQCAEVGGETPQLCTRSACAPQIAGVRSPSFMSAQRLFIAIDLPDQIAESLAALDPHYRGLAFSPPQQIHLTLAFFAAVESSTADLLKEKLATISFRAFFLPVTGLGTFSKKGMPYILWIGVGHAHPHLFQLYKRVNEAALACNLPIEERAWAPHFTIARARGISPALMKSFLNKYRDYDAGMIHVEEFRLYSSKLTGAGPIHTAELIVRSRE